MKDANTALVTGILGQDGSYLTELLVARGCHVHGIDIFPDDFDIARTDHPFGDMTRGKGRVQFHQADLTSADDLEKLFDKTRPDEVYNLAARSFVHSSFDQPLETADTNALVPLRILEIIRRSARPVRFFQASSSDMYGKARQSPQNEETPFFPRSPYACAKAFAYFQTINYRESYGVFACNGILFNHESPRRGEHFVTRKITRAAARIKLGLQDKLQLGNIDMRRDWGFAGDYVRAMMLMLQADQPDDYVIATGEMHSIRDFLDRAFSRLSLDWRNHVEIDPRFFRPADLDFIVGDAAKARDKLGWRPTMGFEEIVDMMVDHDVRLVESEVKTDMR